MKDSYRKFVRQGRCLGHSSPVVCLDWSQDGVRMIMIMMMMIMIVNDDDDDGYDNDIV